MASRISRMTDPGPPIPPEHRLDPLSRYIFDHYAHHLTTEEAATVRYRLLRAKRIGIDSAEATPGQQDSRILELEQNFPDQFARIRKEGVQPVIVSIRDRVIRDHHDEIVLNRCHRCNALCRTPRARQCVECGHDWHSPEIRT